MIGGFMQPATRAVKEVRTALGSEACDLMSAVRRSVTTWTGEIRQDLALIQKNLGDLEG